MPSLQKSQTIKSDQETQQPETTAEQMVAEEETQEQT